MAKGDVRAGGPVGSGYARRLVIMVKEPVGGRVKTRLGHDIGLPAATNFYRHTLAHVTSRLSSDPRWRTLLSVAPASAIGSRALPPLSRIAQSAGDIGARMQSIFDWPVAGPIVIVGTDIPAVHPGHIARAFQALGRHDVVFGPASDGGFWLVGMRRSPRTIDAFGAVRWSTCHTLSDCLACLPSLRVALVDRLVDTDEAADLPLVAGAIGRRVHPNR